MTDVDSENEKILAVSKEITVQASRELTRDTPPLSNIDYGIVIDTSDIAKKISNGIYKGAFIKVTNKDTGKTGYIELTKETSILIYPYTNDITGHPLGEGNYEIEVIAYNKDNVYRASLEEEITVQPEAYTVDIYFGEDENAVYIDMSNLVKMLSDPQRVFIEITDLDTRKTTYIDVKDFTNPMVRLSSIDRDYEGKPLGEGNFKMVIVGYNKSKILRSTPFRVEFFDPNEDSDKKPKNKSSPINISTISNDESSPYQHTYFSVDTTEKPAGSLASLKLTYDIQASSPDNINYDSNAYTGIRIQEYRNLTGGLKLKVKSSFDAKFKIRLTDKNKNKAVIPMVMNFRGDWEDVTITSTQIKLVCGNKIDPANIESIDIYFDSSTPDNEGTFYVSGLYQPKDGDYYLEVEDDSKYIETVITNKDETIERFHWIGYICKLLVDKSGELEVRSIEELSSDKKKEHGFLYQPDYKVEEFLPTVDVKDRIVDRNYLRLDRYFKKADIPLDGGLTIWENIANNYDKWYLLKINPYIDRGYRSLVSIQRIYNVVESEGTKEIYDSGLLIDGRGVSECIKEKVSKSDFKESDICIYRSDYAYLGELDFWETRILIFSKTKVGPRGLKEPPIGLGDFKITPNFYWRGANIIYGVMGIPFTISSTPEDITDDILTSKGKGSKPCSVHGISVDAEFLREHYQEEHHLGAFIEVYKPPKEEGKSGKVSYIDIVSEDTIFISPLTRNEKGLPIGEGKYNITAYTYTDKGIYYKKVTDVDLVNPTEIKEDIIVESEEEIKAFIYTSSLSEGAFVEIYNVVDRKSYYIEVTASDIEGGLIEITPSDKDRAGKEIGEGYFVITVIDPNFVDPMENNKVRYKSKEVALLIEEEPETIVEISDSQLLVNGTRYQIKGVCWNPTGIGSLGKPEFGEWYKTDIPLMKEMGINTVRTYRPIWDKEVLDELNSNGIKVIIGFNKEDIESGKYTEYIAEYKEHPTILMWEFGNEYNYHPEYFEDYDVENWYQLLKEATSVAHFIDPYHPISTALADIKEGGKYKWLSYSYLPEAAAKSIEAGVDIIGLNCYRGSDYSSVIEDIKQIIKDEGLEDNDIPIYFSEGGTDSWDNGVGIEDQITQANTAISIYNSIKDKEGCLGITFFEWNDEWWKAGNPESHDAEGEELSSLPPDGYANEEYWGFVDVNRSPKEIHYELQKIWKEEISSESEGIEGKEDIAILSIQDTENSQTSLFLTNLTLSLIINPFPLHIQTTQASSTNSEHEKKNSDKEKGRKLYCIYKNKSSPIKIRTISNDESSPYQHTYFSVDTEDKPEGEPAFLNLIYNISSTDTNAYTGIRIDLENKKLIEGINFKVKFLVEDIATTPENADFKFKLRFSDKDHNVTTIPVTIENRNIWEEVSIDGNTIKSANSPIDTENIEFLELYFDSQTQPNTGILYVSGIYQPKDGDCYWEEVETKTKEIKERQRFTRAFFICKVAIKTEDDGFKVENRADLEDIKIADYKIPPGDYQIRDYQHTAKGKLNPRGYVAYYYDKKDCTVSFDKNLSILENIAGEDFEDHKGRENGMFDPDDSKESYMDSNKNGRYDAMNRENWFSSELAIYLDGVYISIFTVNKIGGHGILVDAINVPEKVNYKGDTLKLFTDGIGIWRKLDKTAEGLPRIAPIQGKKILLFSSSRLQGEEIGKGEFFFEVKLTWTKLNGGIKEICTPYWIWNFPISSDPNPLYFESPPTPIIDELDHSDPADDKHYGVLIDGKGLSENAYIEIMDAEDLTDVHYISDISEKVILLSSLSNLTVHDVYKIRTMDYDENSISANTFALTIDTEARELENATNELPWLKSDMAKTYSSFRFVFVDRENKCVGIGNVSRSDKEWYAVPIPDNANTLQGYFEYWHSITGTNYGASYFIALESSSGQYHAREWKKDVWCDDLNNIYPFFLNVSKRRGGMIFIWFGLNKDDKCDTDTKQLAYDLIASTQARIDELKQKAINTSEIEELLSLAMANYKSYEDYIAAADIATLAKSRADLAYYNAKSLSSIDFDSFSPSLSLSMAYEHLYEKMNEFHASFDVYTDFCAAGNHFPMLAQIRKDVKEEDVKMNLSCYEKPHSGDTCIGCKFNGTGTGWGGWYFMNGVLKGEETQPKANWGEYPNAGFNLTGATKLSFWAKGEKGWERVEFFAFGIGRAKGPYPDSSSKESLGYCTLCDEWQQYTIDLRDVNLSYVLGGFGWVTNAVQNDNRPITFYIDDIKYNKKRLDEPRLLVSYELYLPKDKPILKNTAYTYDNALALLAFLARGNENDLRYARLIGDAFVYAIYNDRNFTDGRLRNAYQGGDLKLFPGWTPHGEPDTVRMPGWWDIENNTWYEDKICVSTRTGDVAWAIIALLSLYEETYNDTYLNASIEMGDWIEEKCRNETVGYTGGYEGWEETANNPKGQNMTLWKSTEHNIDAYVAFFRLYNLTGEDKWKDRALHAKRFVEAMWNETEGHFWTGTLNNDTINNASVPTDVQAWTIMALNETNKYKRGIKWVEKNCYNESDGFKGFDFNNDTDDDTDGVWFEGTAQMVVAYQMLGDSTNATLYLAELERAQKEAQNANGKGLVAASHDNVSTGFGWYYDARPHIGATAWYIFAGSEYNPYWNINTSESLPSLVSTQI